jgi:hypothetical protein
VGAQIATPAEVFVDERYSGPRRSGSSVEESPEVWGPSHRGWVRTALPRGGVDAVPPSRRDRKRNVTRPFGCEERRGFNSATEVPPVASASPLVSRPLFGQEETNRTAANTARTIGTDGGSAFRYTSFYLNSNPRWAIR